MTSKREINVVKEAWRRIKEVRFCKFSRGRKEETYWKFRQREWRKRKGLKEAREAIEEIKEYGRESYSRNRTNERSNVARNAITIKEIWNRRMKMRIVINIARIILERGREN